MRQQYNNNNNDSNSNKIDNDNSLSDQIHNKSLQFHNQIRNRQRRDMITSLRKQYQHMYIHHNNNNSSNNTNNSNSNISNSNNSNSYAYNNINNRQHINDKCRYTDIIKQQKHYQYHQYNNNNNNIFNTPNTSNNTHKQHPHYIDQYPLHSKTLEKYHNIPHTQIWKYLSQITQHLIQHNIYLSIYMEQQSQTIHHIEEDNQNIIGHNQQHKLIHDLFYLTLEHYGLFKFPRKFKFVRNGDMLVASYVAVVSRDIMPEELVYWIYYMSQEDKDIVYLGIIGDGIFCDNGHMDDIKESKHSSMDDDKYEYNKSNNKISHKLDLHYQTWVNHPILRDTLLSDFMSQKSAAKAVRQIVGFRQVHPNRLKNRKGQNLYKILCRMLSSQLQCMKKLPSSSPINIDNNDNNNNDNQSSQDSITNINIMNQHIQICVKVLIARILDIDTDMRSNRYNQQQQDNNQLIILLTKILTKYIQTQKQLITPLFCIWVIDGLLDNGIRVMGDIGYQIIVNFVRYDINKFINTNTSNNKDRDKDNNKQYDGQYKIYIKQDRFNKFEQYVYKHILNKNTGMDKDKDKDKEKKSKMYYWAEQDGQKQDEEQEQEQKEYCNVDNNLKTYEIDEEVRQQDNGYKDS